MAKLNLDDVADIRADSAAVVINNNNVLVEEAVENTLSRDGSTPNFMNADLDMNSNRIMNLPAPLTAGEPARAQDLLDVQLGSLTIPLPVLQGGTGASTATDARTNLGSGDVFGPASATAAHIPVFADTSGKLLASGNKSLPSGTVVGTTDTQTLTNKTLTTPVISTISNTGTLTLPTSTDTLVGRATTDTFTNKTLTAPKIGLIADSNGNEEIIFTTAASAVNEFTVGNAGTNSAPMLSVTGGDTDVSMSFKTKGAGAYNFLATASGPTAIRLFEDADNGLNYIALIVPSSITSDKVLILPDVSDTLVSKTSTDTFTNKTFNTAGAGNVFQINGTTITANTGTGSNVLATTPTLTTPVLGVASATSINFGGNTLSNYTEGVWTPVLTFATPGNLTVAYSAQQGTYTRIGRLISVSYLIVTSTFTHTTASGNLKVTGLPFTNGSFQFFGTCSYQGITKATTPVVYSRVVNNVAEVDFPASGSGAGLSNVSTADMPTGGTVILSGNIMYQV